MTPETTNDTTGAGEELRSSSEQRMARLLKLQHECNAALTCLYIAVDERIAKDVNDKVRAYIAAIETEKQPSATKLMDSKNSGASNTENGGEKALVEELNRVINRFRAEWNITYAGAIGALEIVKLDLYNEATEVE